MVVDCGDEVEFCLECVDWGSYRVEAGQGFLDPRGATSDIAGRSDIAALTISMRTRCLRYRYEQCAI